MFQNPTWEVELKMHNVPLRTYVHVHPNSGASLPFGNHGTYRK